MEGELLTREDLFIFRYRIVCHSSYFPSAVPHTPDSGVLSVEWCAFVWETGGAPPTDGAQTCAVHTERFFPPAVPVGAGRCFRAPEGRVWRSWGCFLFHMCAQLFFLFLVPCGWFSPPAPTSTIPQKSLFCVITLQGGGVGFSYFVPRVASTSRVAPAVSTVNVTVSPGE